MGVITGVVKFMVSEGTLMAEFSIVKRLQIPFLSRTIFVRLDLLFFSHGSVRLANYRFLKMNDGSTLDLK